MDSASQDEKQKNSKTEDLNINFLDGFGFDPNWTLEEAIEASDSSQPNSPLFRWVGWNELKEYKLRYEAGDKKALMTALFICACRDLPMPEWVAQEYANGFHKWFGFHVKTLDEAFDIEWPKGKHLHTKRQESILNISVPLEVKSRVAKGESITDKLFESVAENLGTNKTKVKEIYYKR